ncbi:MAG TPA: thioredoxin family protein [Candidatus Angelobacter sp.]|nr:thioredoxin family protein [Candidatus Angelobacter sp.]
MPAITSVVTAARFAQGFTYADFVAQAAVNQDKFVANGKTVPLGEQDVAFLRKAAAHPRGPAKMLALAEAWCGDVYRELPTAARIAEATGMELRVFLRDQNLDIMDEFLSNDGKSRAIPVFVFYTKEFEYLTHWTERSASAHAGLAAAMKEAKEKLSLPPSATFATLPDKDRQALLLELVARVRPFTDQWRRDAIQEISQLLANALSIPNAG